MNPMLVAGLLALVASFILGVARLPAKILAIQRSLARMLGVVYACDRSRLDLVGIQAELLASPHLPLHFLEQRPIGWSQSSVQLVEDGSL